MWYPGYDVVSSTDMSIPTPLNQKDLSQITTNIQTLAKENRVGCKKREIDTVVKRWEHYGNCSEGNHATT